MGAGKMVTGRIGLKLPGGTIEAEVDLPADPVPLEGMLPLARALTDRVVELTIHQVEAEGRRISCLAGCGACCRQLVPISEVEARRVAALVESMPEPRRSAVRDRFAAASERLDAAGLLEPLASDDRLSWDKEQRGRFGRSYFAQGIPCPFLEEESCSIHPERPLTCREYLVTSPAEHCARPAPGKVEGVHLPGSVWTAFARLCDPSPSATSIRWVPLVLAPSWAESHPGSPPPRPGPDWLRGLLSLFARKEMPGIEPAVASDDPAPARPAGPDPD